MSDYCLYIVPDDPHYVPSKERIGHVTLFLERLCPGAEIEATASQGVRFVDSGSNLHALYCPECGKRLEWSWWQSVMSEKYKNGFAELGVETPCCGYQTDLNSLVYDWPAGFARFVISLKNPHRDLTEQNLDEIAATLGTGVKVIRAHY